MASVTLDGALIHDAASFHSAAKLAFGFPDFYSNTMDAWVDCLSYLRDDEAMCAFRLSPDEQLDIYLDHASTMRLNAPDLLDELQYLVGALNERYADYGEKPALALHLR